MKSLLFFMGIGLSLVQYPDGIIAGEYHNLGSKEQEIAFVQRHEGGSAVGQAYAAAIEMKQASYALLPWKKLKIFNSGKSKLENLIAKHPNNLHMRYIRLSIQERIPGILKYRKNIEEDKEIIINFLRVEDETDYLDKYIRKNTSL